MRIIKELVIHCSDSPLGRDDDASDIKRWHLARGWRDIGYHYVILLDGTIQSGRPVEQSGAHVIGHNLNSIGICYIGGEDGRDTRTEEQKRSLEVLLGMLRRMYWDAEILGHRDFENVYKACPGFNAREEYEGI